MSQRIRAAKARRRRSFTVLWIFGLAVSVFLLIYFEQTALLYILATLGVTVLMVIVAMADLGQGDGSSAQTTDAQATVTRASSSASTGKS